MAQLNIAQTRLVSASVDCRPKSHFSAHPLLLLLLDSRALVLMICEGLRASFRALTAAHGGADAPPFFITFAPKTCELPLAGFGSPL